MGMRAPEQKVWSPPRVSIHPITDITLAIGGTQCDLLSLTSGDVLKDNLTCRL